jgi:uncharacterized protein (DUF58 family)
MRERVVEGWPPTRGRNQILGLVDFLAAVEPSGRTRLNEGLAEYALRSREPGLVVVLSDLLDPGGFEVGVRALLERRFDVHLLHLLDPEEMNPTLGGDLRLTDSETGEQRDLTVDGDAVRAYRDRLYQFLERVEGACRNREIGYHRVITDTPVEEFVIAQLRGRLLA